MRTLGISLAVAGLAGFGLVGPGQADSGFDNKYQDDTITRTCDSGTVVFEGPTKLWPPNHKLQDVSITATDDSGDSVSLEIIPNPDQVAGGEKGSGGPQHDPDIFFPEGMVASGQPSATVPVQLRSERSGQSKDGRTYVLNWAAQFDNGNPLTGSCTSEDEGQEPFTVFVPHDMRGGADWK